MLIQYRGETDNHLGARMPKKKNRGAKMYFLGIYMFSISNEKKIRLDGLVV